ncbi:hypothetical protein N5D48_16220 [Pseudomonas sp. GD03858]|uniref:SpvB/TcaC N-terminal domain-containing protein n=1 Tax=unclassified Pseudomonas TaxID=196821 RepID=UPI00244C0A6C|nr:MULTISPECIES: SpvB/TcaC N-terminal domain-containing protein [unclassified Pseudomonas]MDH0647772.1 hypothetical protein [Pseudomonas sp. GD03867]MDH0663958.1 hypothetical protein [Pseudomonas sp. GD03858]
MSEQTAPFSSQGTRAPFYTPPSLPKGGGTVSVGGGMLSSGGPDGAAGWQLPLPSPAGRALSASLALQYSSSGGNSAFGAGWECSLPSIYRMSRFGFPRYAGNDRMVGPSGEEILLAGAARRSTHLPFSNDMGAYRVTPWQSRTGGLMERLEHWVDEAVAGDPGFWLHYLADGSLSLYGWSAGARLRDPENPGHVAGWHIEETVSARGEHVVYRYRDEDDQGCDALELAAHPRVANLYPQAVYAMNATPSQALLIPRDGFDATDFLTFTVFDYGERGADPDTPPAPHPVRDWPVREDRHSFWRYGFDVRLRRLCRDVLLWHRTARMAGRADDTPELVSRLHLQYDSSPVASILVSAQQLTDEPTSRLPPLEFELTQPGRAQPGWETVAELDGFWSPAWQMADLHGDGIPGLLYLEEGAWHYRTPQRKVGSQDAVTWGASAPLPLRPGNASGTLVDLDSDGRPEWLVTAGGLRGSFTLAPDGTWGGLVPLTALPVEYAHPLAQLTDLTGDGRPDVVMLRALGPRSVRLYPSAGSAGWMAAMTSAYSGREPLPSVDDAERQLVAFADPAGSGQNHLMRITGDSVTLWPSLGYGRFGEAQAIPGFAVDDFTAARVLLADTDGAGTTDILYLQADGIRVFISQCGNRYEEREFVPAPEGVALDPTCKLQVVDLQGQGTAQLLLTVPHHGPDNAPRSWLYRFNDQRPWLLETVVDNAGSRTQLTYRSSAQAWLDEKAAAQACGDPAPVSHLPFPVHTLSRVTTINEITGLCLGSETTYLGGVWDGDEREFAGFTRLIQTDTHAIAEATAAQLSPPARVCTWFHSGVEARDAVAQEACTDMDAAFPQGPLRFTRWTDQGEQVFDPAPDLRAWLYRAVRGQVMRTEVYGDDGDARADRPYRVERSRLCIRAHASADSLRPSALVTAQQSLTFNCERITEDPVVTQAIVLEQDAYGNVLQNVAIHYPRQLSAEDLRREEAARRIYPASLPEGLIEASCDPQQYTCWVDLTRATVHNLLQGDDFVIGLPGSTRRDVLRFAGVDVPPGGFSVEMLQEQGLPLDDPDRTTLAGYEKVLWRGADGCGVSSTPSRQALVAYTRTAMLDKTSLDVLRSTFEQTLHELVEDGMGAADPAVLGRVRQRLPAMDQPETLYGLLLAYLRTATVDEEGCQLLRRALKTVISVDALRERLLAAPAAELPAGLQAALPGKSRVADGDLGAVVAWFGRQEPQGGPVLTALQGAVASALSAASADALFWRALMAVLNSADLAREMAAEAQSWLDEVRAWLGTPVQAQSLAELLRRGGYVAMSRPEDAPELADPQDPEALGAPAIPGLPRVEEAFAGHHGITAYQGAAHFWQPAMVQESTVTGPSRLVYSAHDITVREVTDAAGLTSTVEAHDWRFLVPVRLKDANDNITQATLDGLGRVAHTRFHGTETPPGSDAAVVTGYSPDLAFEPPLTVEQAVALNQTKGVPVAMAFTVVADSWMPLALRPDGSLDERRRCGVLRWRREAERLRRDGIAPSSGLTGRVPPHVIRIQTDRYDSDPEQQVRVQVTLSGGEQLLQTAILNPPGKAFVRTDEGALQTDDRGCAVVADATIRWAVTGKTRFDNKGQAVQVWLPFYLDDWRWVSDDSAREGIHADRHVYDALGRESRVIRASGEDVLGQWANYERREQVYPWFTVREDENDTWQEVVEQARLKARSTLH